MKTPILDFVKGYAAGDVSRFHMPGHKGVGALGIESFDITEVCGADTLYSADGIILESEKNAAELFGTAHTYYSTEGSTLAIKAMLATALLNAPDGASRTLVAARNAHKALIYAAAELDFDISWICSDDNDHFCRCLVSATSLRELLSKSLPFAVYITYPDYLGNLSDITEISAVCHEFGVPLLVDNAHGAYLAFCEKNLHPIALGADMCADSAHKTLPVLTGGAYLHISKSANADYVDTARKMLSAFASTSPSYITLCSLDSCNGELSAGYSCDVKRCCRRVEQIKTELSDMGFAPELTEPMKIVFHTRNFGYGGAELAEHFRKFSIEVEFADTEYTVLMVSPQNTERDFERLIRAISSLEKREPVECEKIPKWVEPKKAASIKDAVFSKSELVDTRCAVGRICASPTVSCPPAVPIVISGELIDERLVEMLLSFNVEKIEVVKTFHKPN